MAAIARAWSWFWLNPWVRTATRPPVTLSLAFLTLGGFVAGVLFWGGFNTVLEATNTEKFCTSCHEMQAERLRGAQGHRALRQSFGRSRELSRLPRAAPVDR